MSKKVIKMNIGLQLLHPLASGSSVSISEDNRLVMIRHGTTTSTFAVYNTPIRKIKNARKEIKWKKWMEVPIGSPVQGIVSRFDISAGEIDPEALRYIRLGLHYTTSLEMQVEGREVNAVMSYILREGDGRVWILGTIDLAEKSSLAKDENVVAVLDILGFSALMETESLDDLERKIKREILPFLGLVESLSGGGIVFGKGDQPEFNPNLGLLGFGMISDTIVLYPNKNTHDPTSVLCQAVAQLMAFFLQMGWLLRGAIAIGSFRAIPNESIFLGTAILSAHNIELAQEWSGCILSQEVVKRFPAEIAELASSGLLLNYPPPMKAGTLKREASSLAVNWFFYKGVGSQSPEKQLENLRKKADKRAQLKLDNTLSFLQRVRKLRLFGAADWQITGIHDNR